MGPDTVESIIILPGSTRVSAILSNGDLAAAVLVQSQRPNAFERRAAGAGMQNADRKRKRGKRQLKRKLRHDDPLHADVSPKRRRQASCTTLSASPNPNAKGSSSSFLRKMKARLSGGHFRMLNEKLYTSSGNEAFDLFKKDPSLFDVYHAGYQEQMSHWPEQPVNSIIKWLKDHSPSFVVADFGCGDAHIAKSVKNVVFSIDLVSNDPSIIACDMSKTPLASSSVDVAVFCLSLMGTNFPSYLEEAHRVLRPSGWLLIAEVKSRLDPNNGGADPNIFSKCVHKLGFSTVSKDFSNKMFVLLMFRKMETNSLRSSIQWPKLKPCLYKRR